MVNWLKQNYILFVIIGLFLLGFIFLVAYTLEFTKTPNKDNNSLEERVAALEASTTAINIINENQGKVLYEILYGVPFQEIRRRAGLK